MQNAECRMQKFITLSVDETIAAGLEFGKRLREEIPGEAGLASAGSAVILLYGEMGAGKTHFVKGIALALGITQVVTSPTFALVNEYKGLSHFDLFRINSIDDLYAIGFYDYIGNGIIAIEWSENVPGLEREFDKYYKICIVKKDDNIREIIIDDSAGS